MARRVAYATGLGVVTRPLTRVGSPWGSNRRGENAMHELGITQEIIAIASEHSQGARVRRIVLEIGKLSAILPDAVRFCFELCSEGTVAEGAELEIVEPPGRARCRECGTEMALEQPFGRCACGCSDLEWLSGEELRIKEMEVV